MDTAVEFGRFTLSSGGTSDRYVDMRRISLHHRGARLVGETILELTGDWDYDAVGGLTFGADPVAGAVLHVAEGQGRRLDGFSVRKSPKLHGLQRRIEGPSVEGRRVLVVDDTTTTGRSPLAAVRALHEAGAEVAGVASVVDRGASEYFTGTGLDYRFVFSLEDLGLG
jgi:orotate phosphoribosyltransferase